MDTAHHSSRVKGARNLCSPLPLAALPGDISPSAAHVHLALLREVVPLATLKVGGPSVGGGGARTFHRPSQAHNILIPFPRLAIIHHIPPKMADIQKIEQHLATRSYIDG